MSPLLVYVVFLVFFFKQKTAYEMRISDWSSDVCSSDLFASTGNRTRAVSLISPSSASPMVGSWCDCSFLLFSHVCEVTMSGTEIQPGSWPISRWRRANRSEEHTSELQSLMRISYAVFCLKKKK